MGFKANYKTTKLFSNFNQQCKLNAKLIFFLKSRFEISSEIV